MKIALKNSTHATKISIPKLPSPGQEGAYIELVKKGRTFIKDKNGRHFKNSLFQVSDLKIIANQTDCNYILFSHSICNYKKGTTEFSTALAVGEFTNSAGKSDFHWDNTFFSSDADADLDLSGIKGFRQKTNLHWLADPSIKRNYRGTDKSTFLEWVEQFKPEENIKQSTSYDDLNMGTYFSVSVLKRWGLLDETKQSKIALLPVNLEIDAPKPPHDPPMYYYGVTYVLAPVYGYHRVGYPDGKSQFLISDIFWPPRWHRT